MGKFAKFDINCVKYFSISIPPFYTGNYSKARLIILSVAIRLLIASFSNPTATDMGNHSISSILKSHTNFVASLRGLRVNIHSDLITSEIVSFNLRLGSRKTKE